MAGGCACDALSCGREILCDTQLRSRSQPPRQRLKHDRVAVRCLDEHLCRSSCGQLSFQLLQSPITFYWLAWQIPMKSKVLAIESAGHQAEQH